MTMSSMEVTHAIPQHINLYVDCGLGDTQRVVSLDRTDYPTENTGILTASPFPLPCKIEFDYGDAKESRKLFTDRMVGRMINDLAREVRVILQAGIVNEKQRKALEDLLQSKVDVIHSSIYDYRVVPHERDE